MTTARFTVHTSLSPSEVMAVITDFGPERSRWWPNVDDAHFKVHGQGPGWAEVTEGTGMAWERERYSWDTASGTVTIDTLDSNLWGPGSGWRYEIVPAAEGADLRVCLTRLPNSFKGKLIAALIPIAGPASAGETIPVRPSQGRESMTSSAARSRSAEEGLKRALTPPPMDARAVGSSVHVPKMPGLVARHRELGYVAGRRTR